MTSISTIRVLLVDDHPAVILGYRCLSDVSPRIEIVATASNSADALVLAHIHHPDIILMDLQMDGVDGLHTTRKIRAELPATAVIAVSGVGNRSRVVEAIIAGAAGYVDKEDSLHVAAAAIEVVAAGGAALGPKMAQAVLDVIRETAQRPFGLTDKERTVIGYLAAGLTYAEISKRMDIHRHTVENHISAIKGKLGARQPADIIQIAHENGLC
ncbi:MAG TPA: response regulator transcription factor [Candidatus Limnocylindrales bacterium]|nr:response regulator transcription factor [Candidatus Limnocylindrales bacterium]